MNLFGDEGKIVNIVERIHPRNPPAKVQRWSIIRDYLVRANGTAGRIEARQHRRAVTRFERLITAKRQAGFNESNVFIIKHYARRKLKHVCDHGQAGKDERTKNRVGRDAKRPSHLSHRSTNHHRLYRRQRILTLDRRATPPQVHRELFRYPTLFCTLRMNRMNVYTRACMFVCVITGGTICYVQYVFAASYTLPRASQCTVPCQYAPDEYRPTFCGPYSKVSPARAYPCNLVYLRIVFIRVSTINWPLEALKSRRLRARARTDDLEVKFYLIASVASIEVI